MQFDERLINEYKGFPNWREMLYKCGQPMIDNSYIKIEYLDLIVNSVVKNGPYFVVADSVAIAHSDINLEHIKKMGISWNIIQNSVLIGDKNQKSVKYLIILSSTNAKEHLEFLQKFSLVFMNENRKKEFYGIENKKELMNYLKINF